MPTSLPAVILGGGVTGLAAGVASGRPVLEGEPHPGGICSSYYMRPGASVRETAAEADGRGYRFEHGGGHWIFGGHRDVLSIIERLAPCDRIARRSAVYFPESQRFVGFPLQHHLHQLDATVARAALAEMLAANDADESPTMAAWLEATFGPTLFALFFEPFHDAYTAGLYRSIAPQDGYKTPLDRQAVVRGATAPAAGYNATFLYPREGLDALMRRLAVHVDWRPGHRVIGIDVGARTLRLDDDRVVHYERALSTLPLNRMLELCGVALPTPAEPFTSVLVLNIGARRGPRYPREHWLYVPRSRSGFHRIGFYDNVAEHFVPAAKRGKELAGCLYVERSYANGARPDADAVARYGRDVVSELRDWGFIDDVDALDATWIDVAYTWSTPGSAWVREATDALAAHGIDLAGRYARWQFQGIADSLRDGLLAGQALRLSL